MGTVTNHNRLRILPRDWDPQILEIPQTPLRFRSQHSAILLEVEFCDRIAPGLLQSRSEGDPKSRRQYREDLEEEDDELTYPTPGTAMSSLIAFLLGSLDKRDPAVGS